MEFFASMKLNGVLGKRSTDLIAAGPLMLEAQENGEVVFGREFDVRYTASENGRTWTQRIEVRAGQEDIFTYEDRGDRKVAAVYDHRDEWAHIKFAIFTQLISDCLEKHDGNLKTVLEFENPPPGLIQTMLELCGGKAN